jgi:hypothetical protein
MVGKRAVRSRSNLNLVAPACPPYNNFLSLETGIEFWLAVRQKAAIRTHQHSWCIRYAIALIGISLLNKGNDELGGFVYPHHLLYLSFSL